MANSIFINLMPIILKDINFVLKCFRKCSFLCSFFKLFQLNYFLKFYVVSVVGFQSLIVLSAEAETKVLLSYKILIAFTAWVWAKILPTKSIFYPFTLPTLICPSLEPA